MRALREVLIRWVFLTFIVMLATVWFFLFIQSKSLQLFTWSFLFFSGFITCAQFIGLYFIKFYNKHLDTTLLVFASSVIRMILSLVFVVLFTIFVSKIDRFAILPFMSIYLVYKIFEVINLSKYSNYLDKRIEQKII